MVWFNLIQISKVYSVCKQCKTDQTPCSVASDLVLHIFMHTFHKKETGLIMVNRTGSEAWDDFGFSKDIRSLLLPPVKLVFSSSLRTKNYHDSRNPVVCVWRGYSDITYIRWYGPFLGFKICYFNIYIYLRAGGGVGTAK